MKLSFSIFGSPLYASVVLALLCLVGCKEPDNKVSDPLSYVAQLFPQDLLYRGVPIHPLCIITTLNDKLPQPVSIEDLQPNLPDDYDIKDHTFSYDLEKKECTGSWKVLVEEDYAPSSYASYIYRGSYKNRHIVQTSEHQYGARDDFETLALFVREKDTICCVSDICQGGIYNVVLENNVLRFEEELAARCIDIIMPRESIAGLGKEIVCIPNDFPGSNNTVRFGCFYEVDLDDPLLTLKLCGISFLEGAHYYDWDEFGNEQEECFSEVALRYIEAGHQTLNLVQTESFVKDVWQAIAEKIALNECEEK
jgi:hypothetical protein